MALANPYTADRLKVLNAFMAKSDGRDKLCATVQYECQLLSAGEPGDLKKIQGSFASARKVFRIMKPIESLVPLLTDPGTSKAPQHQQMLAKLKALLMSLYFAGDHVSWAKSVGLFNDAEKAERAQKMSMYCWMGASLCTIISELEEIGNAFNASQQAAAAAAADTAAVSSSSSKPDEVARRKAREEEAAALKAVQKRLLTLTHAVTQASLAAGLSGLVPMKPRTIGALGVAASAMNVYMLMPPLPSHAKRA